MCALIRQAARDFPPFSAGCTAVVNEYLAKIDVSNLIVLVEKNPELYNLRHPEYFNIVRRENIWEEIGAVPSVHAVPQ